MAIHFHFEDVKSLSFPRQQTKDWLRQVVAREGKSLGLVNIILCSDSYLQSLNYQYLKHDELTDIITFDNSGGEEVAGELYISIERVKENAKKFEAKTLTELSRVMVHGVLHLLGYQDKTNKTRSEMQQKENYYLSQIS